MRRFMLLAALLLPYSALGQSFPCNGLVGFCQISPQTSGGGAFVHSKLLANTGSVLLSNTGSAILVQ